MSQNEKKALNDKNFEEALSELEKIVKQLESDDLPLEEAFTHFEEGVRLSTFCQQKLSGIEEKILILKKKIDSGELLNDINAEEKSSKKKSKSKTSKSSDTEERIAQNFDLFNKSTE